MSSGHANQPPSEPPLPRVLPDDLCVGNTVGSADLEDRALAGSMSSAARRYSSRSSIAIGWAPVSTHRGVIMTGRRSTSARTISYDSAAGTDHDRGPKLDRRDARGAKDLADLLPARQMG